MSGQLRAVPETAERALGLIRVSKERHGMVAPEVQRAAIEDYCAHRGYRIHGWLEGLDQSGSRARSAWWPRLDQAVGWVEAGEYDVIVAWKFSRTARNRLRWAVAIDRVETAGGRLESATEQVDTSTSTGRFTRGMLAELNAFEAERIGEVWSEVHESRVRRGLPPTGKPKFGYAYDKARKLHVPDPVTGPVLATAYRRYLAGESVYSLVRWLNTTGIRTLNDGPWSERTLRRVLDSGFAAGKFAWHGELRDGVHEPLITGEEWTAYEDARVRRRKTGPRRERSTYLLSGLVVCDRCDGRMVAGQFGHAHQPKYRCKRGKEQGTHTGGYITARFVETAVYDWLVEFAHGPSAAEVEAKAHQTITNADAGRLARKVGQLEAALTRLAVQNAETPLPPSVYRASYDELAGQLVRAQAEHETLAREQRRTPADPRKVARDLLADWDDLQVAGRREGLGQLIREIRVTTGRPRGTVDIVPTWA